MKARELRDRLTRIIEKSGCEDADISCSVDMSVHGDEDTYDRRVFGKGVCDIVPTSTGGYNGEVIELTLCFEVGSKNYKDENQWVPVQERMPKLRPQKTELRPLLIVSNGVVLKVVYSSEGWFNGGFDDYGFKIPPEDVSHWMPMPKAPKSKATS